MTLFLPICQKILICILENNNKSIISISKKMDNTYSCINKTLRELEKVKLVKYTSEGRSKIITLTPEGIYFASIFNEFKIKINEVKK